jgi:hypothetical protein
MLQHLKVQLVEVLNGVGGSVRMGIIVQHCDIFKSIPRHLFKKMVSAGPEVVHRNGQYLLLCPSHFSVLELALMHPTYI